MASSVEPVSLSQIKKVEGVRAQWTLREVEVALDETREQRERRIRELFTMFDCENSGYLDHAQVEKGFKALIPSHYKYAKDLLDVCDSNHDGRVDFQEFHKYIDEKEVELYNMFQQIDVTNDGSIRPEELRDALRTAGIHINDDDLSKFVEHIDRDKNGIITFEEWRDFLLLFPHAGTIIQVYQYWEKVCQVDIGEQAIIPEGISRHLHASKYLIAGGVAGAISRTATAPLDRLKVILQVQTHTSGSTSLVRGLMQIYRESGLVGFFRGNGINILKVVPEQAIKFYAFEMMKDFIATKGEEEEEEKEEEENKNKKSIGTVGRLVAGGVAGAIAQTFVYPMDVLKTRLQVHSSPSPPLNSLLRNIWIEEGPVALFRGIVPSLIGIVPYAGIDLATYETLKDLSRRLPFFADGKNEPGPWTQLACGTVSGALGATCVYPLQLVRTRLQAQSMNAEGRYTGMSDVIRRTWKHEGVRGFYKGLMPNLCKVAPAASITYVVYERMKKTLSIS